VIFIDTGAFVARFVVRDQFHDEAVLAWDQLRDSELGCVTSNFVLDETFTLLARRTSYRFAAQRARNLLTSDQLEILRPGQDDELQALARFEKFADQRVSFTDCVSFELMKSRRVQRVFSFDRHFALAGFEMWPGGWSMVHEPESRYRGEVDG
jgi:predicted nucleic acid-binding protein